MIRGCANICSPPPTPSIDTYWLIMDTGNRFWGYRGYFQGNKFNAGKFKQKFPSSPTLVASIIQSFIELPPFSTPMEHPRKRTNVLSLRLKEQIFERKGNLICLLVPLFHSLVFGGVYIYIYKYSWWWRAKCWMKSETEIILMMLMMTSNMLNEEWNRKNFDDAVSPPRSIIGAGWKLSLFSEVSSTPDGFSHCYCDICWSVFLFRTHRKNHKINSSSQTGSLESLDFEKHKTSYASKRLTPQELDLKSNTQHEWPHSSFGNPKFESIKHVICNVSLWLRKIPHLSAVHRIF